MIVGKSVNDYERRTVASEWDHGWFYYDCDKLEHWKEKAFIVDGKPHCRCCAEKHAEKGEG